MRASEFDSENERTDREKGWMDGGREERRREEGCGAWYVYLRSRSTSSTSALLRRGTPVDVAELSHGAEIMSGTRAECITYADRNNWVRK